MALRAPLLVVLACSSGCNVGPAPQKVTPELPEIVASTNPLLVTVRVRDASGRADVAKPPLETSITPEDVAEIGKDGTLRCKKNGDAKVTVTVRGVSGSAPLRCRLVDRVEVPALERLDISKGSFVLQAKALAKNGSEIHDVPITITPTKGRPAKIKGLEVTPTEVGETELIVRAGSAESKLPVEVVRSIQPEALPLKDGKRINFSLDEGKYQITVKLASEKPLAIEWRGAPYCDYKGKPATTHSVTCVLQRKGGVVTDNPKFLDSGETTVSHDQIELLEVP